MGVHGRRHGLGGRVSWLRRGTEGVSAGGGRWHFVSASGGVLLVSYGHILLADWQWVWEWT